MSQVAAPPVVVGSLVDVTVVVAADVVVAVVAVVVVVVVTVSVSPVVGAEDELQAQSVRKATAWRMHPGYFKAASRCD